MQITHSVKQKEESEEEKEAPPLLFLFY